MEIVRGEMATSTAFPDRFEDFYRAYRAQLVRALVLSLGDHDLGVEAADEAMVRAYQRWRTVRKYRNPMGWVYTVGVNWGRSRLRRRRRERPGLENVQATSTASPDVGVEMREALAALSLNQRSVVVLRYYLGLSNAETAQALGIAAGTVKSRLSRALDRLGRSLGVER